MTGTLLYLTLGMALVLLLRKPVRRLLGAGPAFTLWLLPLLLGILPWLPAAPAAWSITPTMIVLPDAVDLMAPMTSTGAVSHWPLLSWLAGSALCLWRLARCYSSLRQQACPLPTALHDALQAELGAHELRRLRLHPAGPAVVWAPRSQLLLPADFLTRFDPPARQLVLRHELTHLRRGDPLWSLLAELTFALLWFHPLAWLALPRLRLDQELACDEAVLRQSPHEEIRYAHTLMHSAGMDLTSALIPWLAEPQLKERLSMIQRHRHGALRRRIGFIGLATLMGGGAFMVQAAMHAPPPSGATQALSYNTRVQPHYPGSAIKNKQQGTVILNLLIGVDGKPIKVNIDPTTKAAPDLVQAASDAAMQWHFNPAMKNGKPIESYARVPVSFSLEKPPAAPTSSST